MGRSQKALKNVSTGLINKIALMFMAFATRTLFIRMLGAEYTGISSLYTNILSVLSLAELGIGNVLTFYLYSPLKEKDETKIRILVTEFKRIYVGIILCILIVGLALIPFLDLIVKSELNRLDLTVYYVLYLINSVASYFVVYRTTVLTADQKSYIQNRCSTISTVVMYAIQVAYLLIWRDFLGYLIIQVLCTIGCNLVLNYIACRRYPYLKKLEKIASSDVVDKKDLIHNVKATFLYKVSDRILDQTDSIIISIMFSTVIVGYYSNYYLLVLYLTNFGGIIANGLTASLGNLNVDGDQEHSYSVFKSTMLLFIVFGTFCTACYACVIQDFIPIWVGSQYLMNYDIVVALLVVFYLRMVTNTVWMYRAAMGLFKEVQYINVAAAGLNIILSVILGKTVGVAGIIIATAVARLVTSFWYEGKVVLNKLGHPSRAYFIQQLRDLATAVVVIAISMLSCSMVGFNGIPGIIIKVCICGIWTGVVELIVNGRSDAFRVLTRKVFQGLKK
ncbi:MAG: oligosaccharide flippase family protein [Clostridiales bacterium]|nr:oligosaccharide flippase family protein [Clostridiales bacterium]